MHTIPNMTEQELLNDLLEQEKQIVKDYATFITEASCPNMRQILIDQFNKTCQSQYDVFEHMKQKGFYQVKDAPDQDVAQTKQQMTQMKSQLPS